MTWKLEKALAVLPYENFDISEEVQEQVHVKAQQCEHDNKTFRCNCIDLSFAFSRLNW